MSAAITSGDAVVVEVERRHRGEDRAVGGVLVDLAAGEGLAARVQRERVAVHRPAGQLAAVAVVRVHDAVGGRDDQLVVVVAVEVDEHRRRRAVARQELREAGQHVLVAVQVEVAPVLAGQRRPEPCTLVTTTRTMKPNGSWFGRLLKFGAAGHRLGTVERSRPPPGSEP